MYKIGSMPSSIQIGFVGETNFRTIEIDMTAWMEKMPAGIPSIIHVRPGETKAQAYIAATDFDEETNVLSWPITAGDIGILEGEGEMQVWLEETADEETTKRGKSVKVITVVNDSANEPDATPPEAQAAYMEQMTALKMATVEAAENVNLHPAYIDSTTKHWMVYDATQHEYVDTQILAEGTDGTDATPTLITVPYEDLTFPVSKDTLCYHGLDLCKAKQDISTSEEWTAAHWDVTTVADELRLQMTAIQGKPDILDSDAEDVDLDFTDEDGNVIMRLEGGHIKTKEFDSSEAGNGDVSIKSSDAVNVDLDLTDSSGNVILRIKDGHIKTKEFDSKIVNSLLESPEVAGTAGQVLGLNSSMKPEWQDAKTPLDLFIDNIDVDYRYDATTNANYTVIRVYKNTIHGEKQYPFVFAPNGAEAAGSRNKSTYEMNTEYGFVLALNAGIFNTNNGQPDGVLIMNGESFQTGASTTHSQCKPLWIDEDGDLHSSAYDTSSADLISQGCVSAVCGFMPIIVDYDPVPSSEWNNVDHYYQNAQRQIIGQFGNGDYAIVTCEGRDYQNSDGWTITEAQTICQAIGLKFAYNLDGGGSTELMLGMKHVNTIYDGQYGRKVPTFIVFNGTTTPPENPTV